MNPDHDHMASLEQWMQEHRDKEAIRALVAAYQRGCDGGWDGPSHADPDYLASLFCVDAIYKIPQHAKPARGRTEITSVFAELQKTLPHVVHYLTNDSIVVDGEQSQGEFKGIAAIWVDGRRRIAFGIYTGHFVKVDGRWRFKSWQFELAHPSPPTDEEQS